MLVGISTDSGNFAHKLHIEKYSSSLSLLLLSTMIGSGGLYLYVIGLDKKLYFCHRVQPNSEVGNMDLERIGFGDYLVCLTVNDIMRVRLQVV